MMTDKALSLAAREINQILRYTDEMEVNKIPKGLRLYFKDIEDVSYLPEINPEDSLFEEKLLPETQKILGMIYCLYWSNENDLQNVPEKVMQNVQQTSDDIFKGYSEEEFLENATQKHAEKLTQESLTTIPKEPWYKRLFGWIKKK